MSLIASLVVVAACSWDNPGANPYKGPVAQSVHNYTDIPLDVRNRLQKRMDAKKYDEVATIERDRIFGKHEYTELRDMHFGNGRMCRTVTRGKWKDGSVERGLVYCEDGHCLIVPTVCNNVSRVTRVPPPTPREGPPGGGGGESPGLLVPPLPVPPMDVGGGGAITSQDMPFVPGLPPVELPPLAPPFTFGSSNPFWPPYSPPPTLIIIPGPIPPIPEPSTWILTLLGLALIAFRARK